LTKHHRTFGLYGGNSALAGLFALCLTGNACGSTTECPPRFDGKRLTHATISDGPSMELPQQTSAEGVSQLPYPKDTSQPYYLVCNYGTTALSLPLRWTPSIGQESG
jgi:hypothetical protein